MNRLNNLSSQIVAPPAAAVANGPPPPTRSSFRNEAELLEEMTTPDRSLLAAAAAGQLPSPVVVLGAAGKMGPSLAVLLRRAGVGRVIGVSRFSDAGSRQFLEEAGVETVVADLAEPGTLERLPDAPSVIMLAGFKFGASAPGNEARTWGINALLPAQVVRRYPTSRIVCVSSGNVYPFSPVAAGGCDESAPTAPVGEYAQSRLGGERLAEYQAAITSTPLCIVRLFYATECRYGVMHDLAQKVVADEPIPLHMGHVNQIWQRDANSMIIRCLGLARHPARTINVSGTQTLSVRDLATRIGAMVGRPPRFEGVEADTALLGKCSAMEAELGQPRVSVAQMLAWVSAWVESGHKSLGKPTKFEARNGRF